jgi:membrane protease YdiL (CAAX protease family)
MIEMPGAYGAVAAPARPPFWRVIGMFVVALIVGFTVMTLAVAIEFASGVPQRALSNAGGAPLQGALIVFDLVTATIVLWRLPAITGLSLHELGLRFPRGADWRIFGYGILGLIGVRIVLIAQMLLLHESGHRQAGFENVHAGNALDVTLTVAALVFVAPFAEELMFRMTLFRTLAQRLPLALAVTIASCIFAAFHADAVLFVTLAMFGAVLALCYRASNCIVVSMLLHGCNNALGAFGLLYLAGRPH